MIQVTRLNGEKFTLNALYIEQVQAFPDTTITLFNSKKLIVKESVMQVAELTEEFYRKIGLSGSMNVTNEDE